MALKKKIAKAEYDALSDVIKAEYKQNGDNYLLDVDDPDNGELTRAHERVKAELVTAKTDLATARTERDKAIFDLAAVPQATRDVVTLENSYKQKIADLGTAHTTELKKVNDQVTKLLITNKAQEIANEISGDNAHLMLPVIEARLRVEDQNGTLTTRILDINGSPSASTITDLKKELVDNPKYAAIVIGSKASGGGANGSGDRTNRNGGAVDKKFAELNDAERKAWFERDPAGFKKASEDHRASLRRF